MRRYRVQLESNTPEGRVRDAALVTALDAVDAVRLAIAIMQTIHPSITGWVSTDIKELPQ